VTRFVQEISGMRQLRRIDDERAVMDDDAWHERAIRNGLGTDVETNAPDELHDARGSAFGRQIHRRAGTAAVYRATGLLRFNAGMV
jgi:hypothetical protein